MAINRRICVIKNEVSNACIDGNPCNHFQGLGLASETDHRLAMAYRHVVARYRPTSIDSVPISGDLLLLVDFSVAFLPRRKRSSRILGNGDKEGVTDKGCDAYRASSWEVGWSLLPLRDLRKLIGRSFANRLKACQ